MDYGDVKDRVRQAVGAADDEMDDEVERFIIDTCLDIEKSFRFPWREGSISIKVWGRLSFNATWTQGAAELTTEATIPTILSDADAAQYNGGLVELNGVNKYEINAWTWNDGAADTFTVIPADIVDATASSATAVLVIQDTIALPATVESVRSIVDMETPKSLRARPGGHHSRFHPDPFDYLGCEPEEWWVKGHNAGNVNIVLFPPPDEDRVYYLEVWTRPTPPVLDTTGDDVDMAVQTGIPERFHSVIVAGSIYRAMKFEFENTEHMNHWYMEYQQGLRDMKSQCRTDAGLVHKLERRRYRNLNNLRYTQDGKVDV